MINVKNPNHSGEQWIYPLIYKEVLIPKPYFLRQQNTGIFLDNKCTFE